jgi:hypothetical protein
MRAQAPLEPLGRARPILSRNCVSGNPGAVQVLPWKNARRGTGSKGPPFLASVRADGRPAYGSEVTATGSLPRYPFQ